MPSASMPMTPNRARPGRRATGRRDAGEVGSVEIELQQVDQGGHPVVGQSGHRAGAGVEMTGISRPPPPALASPQPAARDGAARPCAAGRRGDGDCTPCPARRHGAGPWMPGPPPPPSPCRSEIFPAAARLMRPAAVVAALTPLLGIEPLGTDLACRRCRAWLCLRRVDPHLAAHAASLIVSFGLRSSPGDPVADRCGRRPVLLAGMALFAAAGVGAALDGSVAALVGWRALQGIAWRRRDLPPFRHPRPVRPGSGAH